jgi:hypothetical protein
MEDIENLKEELGNYLVDGNYRTYVFEKLDEIKEILEEKDEKIEELENEIFGLID